MARRIARGLDGWHGHSRFSGMAMLRAWRRPGSMVTPKRTGDDHATLPLQLTHYMARRIARAFGWAALVTAVLVSAASAEMATRRWGKPPAREPGAEAKAPRDAPPTCYVVAASTPPTIDGKLDDEVWKQAQICPLSRTLDGTGAAAEPAEVRLLRDDKTLYLAFRCTEPLLGKVQASQRGQDGGIWEDDSVEFFLGVGGAYYHFGVNALGSTYDGKGKDASWNSGFQAAVGREARAWTVEAAVPLAKLAGPGAVPTDWTANFNRNRHAAGTWQESAWSPTFSGESHVPDRFGKMLLRAPPAPQAGEKPVVRKESLTILPAQGGEGIVRFDLAELPRGAKVYRADLRIARTARVDGRMEEALVDIAIYPVTDGAADRPDAGGRPLALRPPWYDRFDATEAVRQWASGKTGGFSVKACPFWNAEATCLDVAYEGKPDKPPPQVAGLEVLHRAGQTFLTWKEIEDPVGKDEIAWGEMRRIAEGLDAQREVRYCVYRHDRPITAANLNEAELIAAVAPLSGWDLNGRNVERPIDIAIETQDVLVCGHWNPFGGANAEDYARECPIDRFAIRDGAKPLPRGTGLYVHTAAAPGKAWYAVVTSVDGVQNTGDISDKNAAGPIEEVPAAPEPVLQKEMPKMMFFNYADKRLHYVTWVAPPCGNLPSQYYNWSVGVPESVLAAGAKAAPVPLELSLHRDGNSYWRTQFRMERNSVVVSPHDFPTSTWWYGYHESLGTLRSFRQGVIQPYTERRLLAFIDWAARKWPIDRNKILVAGCRGGASGSGALHLGLRHPEVFALVVSGHGLPSYAETAASPDRQSIAAALGMQAIWGNVAWAMKTDTGASVWEEHDMTRRVAAAPAASVLPLLALTSDNGPLVRAFHRVCLESGRPLIAEFSWGGTRYVPVTASETFPNAVRLDVRKDAAVLAFSTPEAVKSLEGGMGEFGGNFTWRDVSDTPQEFQATVLGGTGKSVADITFRQLQQFKVAAGKMYHWTIRDLKPPPAGARTQKPDVPPPPTDGDVMVGDDGVLRIKGISLPGEARLFVGPK